MGKDIKGILTTSEAFQLLDIIHSSTEAATRDDCAQLVTSLQEIIPFDYATTGFAQFDPLGQVTASDIVNVNYPETWLQLYVEQCYANVDPIVRENFTSFRLQRWEDTYRRNPSAKEFIRSAAEFGLAQGYTHGVRDYRGTEGTIFSFAGQIECSTRTEKIIKRVVPHLHVALLTVLTNEKARNMPKPLSPREIEVLKWIAAGKSDWDIGILLGISERTVSFHVANVVKKLNVATRAHAVATAIKIGLISLDW
jgi:DNA-binding CsgD family transcriptional regulator